MDLGAPNLRHGEIGIVKITDTELRRLKVQDAIDASKTIENRRLMGQFATPGELARAIVRETISCLPRDGSTLAMLEPSMGSGSFVSAALDLLGKRIRRIRGYELDSDFHRASLDLWNGYPVDPIHEDFTRAVPTPAFDLVVANPPYVRHHGLKPAEKRRLQELVCAQHGIDISGLAGLYCYFLLLSKAWMKPDAVGVWLIPSEWMAVNYGRAVRRFLAGSAKLLRVHKFDVSDVRFSDALVSSCVVWFRNAKPDGNKVEFTYGADLTHPERRESIDVSSLNPDEKWPPRTDGGQAGGAWRIGDFFDIRRGIATGDNAFFVLTERDVVERKIPNRFLRPILPSPRHLKVDHVKSDEHGLPTNAERRFLLDCTGYAKDDLPSPVRTYIESGEATTAQRNLCSSRTVWYEQEQRVPAPFLCSYMGRGGVDSAPVRFILNDTKAIVSNSFLMLYPKSQLAQALLDDPAKAKRVWSMLLAIPREQIVSAGRSYGGGLQKVEPRELARIPCDELHDWLCESGATIFREEAKGQLRFFA